MLPTRDLVDELQLMAEGIEAEARELFAARAWPSSRRSAMRRARPEQYRLTVPAARPSELRGAGARAARPGGVGRAPTRVAKTGMAALTLGALGVVFGDIGTSPLYALQTVFTADHHAVHATAGDVYGVISLVFWSITMVVSVKYVTFIMRADNDGEGGIMALTALVQRAQVNSAMAKLLLVTLGILGASLFYGDGAITPAISVLSAVEGVKVAVPSLHSIVLPITVAVLTGLFAIQRYGTKLVGNLFGPVMALWFGVLALTGIVEIAQHPAVLRALSPTYGAKFMFAHGHVAFIALGSVVLAVTGAEALYADMGHFGRSPIRRAWFWLVFPALTLEYLAQGSEILRSPKSVSNPFFLLMPAWAQIPMVLLATVATVIASQAVISGAFSVTHQAVQLGFLPRLTIRHTSRREVGQVYAPGDQRRAVRDRRGDRRRLRLLGGARLRLRRRRHRHVHPQHDPVPRRREAAVAPLVAADRARRARLPEHRGDVLRGQPDEGRARRLAAAGDRRGRLHGADDLAQGTRDRQRQPRRARRGRCRSFIDELERRASPRSRRVPGTAVYLNAHAQTTPLALRANVEHNHVAARARDHRLDRDRARPARLPRRSALLRRARARRRRHHRAVGALRLPGRAERPGDAPPGRPPGAAGAVAGRRARDPTSSRRSRSCRRGRAA